MEIRSLVCYLTVLSVIHGNTAKFTDQQSSINNIANAADSNLTDQQSSINNIANADDSNLTDKKLNLNEMPRNDKKEHSYDSPKANSADNAIRDLKSVVEDLEVKLRVQVEQMSYVLARLDDAPVQRAANVSGGGSTYVRWGRTQCPANATFVYQGYVGKTAHAIGGGMNYQCLPTDPEFAPSAVPDFQSESFMYGVEYRESPVLPEEADHANAVCATCSVDRGHLLMIPAKLTCPAGWVKEYSGWLVAQKVDQRASTFECLDGDAEAVPGSSDSEEGGIFRVVEVACGILPCPPYEDGLELSCVVCTK